MKKIGANLVITREYRLKLSLELQLLLLSVPILAQESTNLAYIQFPKKAGPHTLFSSDAQYH